jgi:UDP-N-acetyl-D-mannosaminuronic acid dehydrogenase
MKDSGMSAQWTGDVCIIGLGYIGLPTATLFAQAGLRVYGVDVNPRVVELIARGESHFSEPDLDVVLQSAVARGGLTTHLAPQPADAFIICVPTPCRPNPDGQTKGCDLSYVLKAADAIAPVLKRGDIVILESTSAIGATEQVEARLAALRPDLSFPSAFGEAADVSLCYCPERVIPGDMLRELVFNDRTIGGLTPKCAERARAMYAAFVRGKLLLTSARVAECVKLSENSFRDVNIAFANELSMICAANKIDVWEVIKLANHHPRVNILSPGPGVGGHCIPLDPWFLYEAAPELAPLIRAARHVNDAKADWVVEQVRAQYRPGSGKIACLGLTYKPDVDDFRESPALEIANKLAAMFPGEVVGVDPFCDMIHHAHVEVNFPLVADFADLDGVGTVVLLVNHQQFRMISIRLGQLVIDPIGLTRTLKRAEAVATEPADARAALPVA